MNISDQKVADAGLPSNCISVDLQSTDSCAASSPAESEPKLPPSLRADCSRCAGLCCVVHSFYAVQGFGFDKPARSACSHLTGENRCDIHSTLSSHGFPGCAAFDCYGAGQRVTRELFAGVRWRKSGEIAARMFSAYETCLVLHRLMAMLALGEAIESPARRAQLLRKRREIDELCRTEEALRTVDVATLQKEVLKLVREISPSSWQKRR